MRTKRYYQIRTIVRVVFWTTLVVALFWYGNLGLTILMEHYYGIRLRP